MNASIKTRLCRKCKVNKVLEARKYCEPCKIAPAHCSCGNVFRSKIHTHCKHCRNIKGNDGECSACGKYRHIYYGSGLCTTCYKFTVKYKITKEKLIELRSIKNCQLCDVEVSHSVFNTKTQAVIDHDHKTGRVRGILCSSCNVIDGRFRDLDHLEAFYKNYRRWIGKEIF